MNRVLILLVVLSLFSAIASASIINGETAVFLSQPPTTSRVKLLSAQEYEQKQLLLSKNSQTEISEELQKHLEKLEQSGCATDEIHRSEKAQKQQHKQFASNLFPIMWLQEQFETSQDSCTTTSECDIPSVRDSYSTYTSVRTIEIEFLIEKGSSFDAVANDRVAVALTELNAGFANTGFQFTATIIRWGPLRDSSGSTVGTWFVSPSCQASWSQPCYSYMSIINAIYDGTTLRSSYWKSNTMVILVQNNQFAPGTAYPAYNGWAHFIWDNNHGIVVVTPQVVQTGYTTIPHEIGHSLGLWHTHHGINELLTNSGTCPNPIDPCYETTISDTTGDYCSDTSPFPNANPAALSTCRAPTVQEIPDPCISRSSWGSDGAVNFMSYMPRTCRTVFTPQQRSRMRCYVAKYGYPATAATLHSFILIVLMTSVLFFF